MKIVERDGVRIVEFEIGKDDELEGNYRRQIAEEAPLRNAVQRALIEYMMAQGKLQEAMQALWQYRAKARDLFWAPLEQRLMQGCGLAETPVLNCNTETGGLTVATPDAPAPLVDGMLQ